MYLDVLFPGAPAVDIAGLAYDNRAVGPRDLFFCVRGFTRDGHEFAADAIARGAAALVVDHLLDLDIPQVVVADVRRGDGTCRRCLLRRSDGDARSGRASPAPTARPRPPI